MLPTATDEQLQRAIGPLALALAVVNSVVDALSPFGVRHLDMPLTPEKIWNVLQGAQA